MIKRTHHSHIHENPFKNPFNAFHSSQVVAFQIVLVFDACKCKTITGIVRSTANIRINLSASFGGCLSSSVLLCHRSWAVQMHGIRLALATFCRLQQWPARHRWNVSHRVCALCTSVHHPNVRQCNLMWTQRNYTVKIIISHLPFAQIDTWEINAWLHCTHYTPAHYNAEFTWLKLICFRGICTLILKVQIFGYSTKKTKEKERGGGRCGKYCRNCV